VAVALEDGIDYMHLLDKVSGHSLWSVVTIIVPARGTVGR